MRKILAAAALAWLCAPCAAARAAPAIALQGCDFFEAELISYLCGGTAFIQPFGAAFDFSQSRAAALARPAGTRFTASRSRQADEGVTLGLTPWEGVRVTVSGEAFQYDNTTRQQIFPVAAPPSPASVSSARGAKGGWLSIGAEYTLLDRVTPQGRTLVNLIGNLENNPAGGPYAARDLQQAGAVLGAKWTLSPTASLNYDGVTMLRRLDDPSQLQLSGASRLLWARDDLGVALGPRLQTTLELWHSPVVKSGWREARLGGEILLAPFRLIGPAALQNITLDLYALHSLGQASLASNANGPARAYEYGASASFHFGY